LRDDEASNKVRLRSLSENIASTSYKPFYFMDPLDITFGEKSNDQNIIASYFLDESEDLGKKTCKS